MSIVAPCSCATSLTDGKPEPTAGAARIAAADEAFENPIPFLRRNADARVGDLDEGLAPMDSAPDGHLRARGGMRDRVVREIADGLIQKPAQRP